MKWFTRLGFEHRSLNWLSSQYQTGLSEHRQSNPFDHHNCNVNMVPAPFPTFLGTEMICNSLLDWLPHPVCDLILYIIWHLWIWFASSNIKSSNSSIGQMSIMSNKQTWTTNKYQDTVSTWMKASGSNWTQNNMNLKVADIPIMHDLVECKKTIDTA